jgi:F-type H+-transporting ATPase subunit delta
MAELSTLARPYAEALFKVVTDAEAVRTGEELDALAAIAGDAQLRQFADSPRTRVSQVQDVIAGVVGMPLSPPVTNLLQAVLDNGRLVVLPEIAAQFHALVNVRSGVSDATIHSAFPIDDAMLADVVTALERRFGRKLTPTVQIDPALIGGIRVVVGDEVLDTSVKARLDQMKAALTA